MSAQNHCPQCGQLLRSESSAPTCPQCGVTCDAERVVIRLRTWRGQDLLLIGGLLLIAGGAIAFTATHELNAIPLTALAGLFALAGGLAYTIVRARWNGYHVAVHAGGVTFDAPAVPVGLVPWEHVGEAEFDASSQQFHLYAPDGTPVFNCDADDLGSARLAERCAAEINARRSRYARSTPTRSAPDQEKRPEADPSIQPRSASALAAQAAMSSSSDHHHEKPASHESSTHTSSS